MAVIIASTHFAHTRGGMARLSWRDVVSKPTVTFHQARSYLRSRIASPSFDEHQIILFSRKPTYKRSLFKKACTTFGAALVRVYATILNDFILGTLYCYFGFRLQYHAEYTSILFDIIYL